MAKVFISFSNFDEDKALLVAHELEADQHRCWFYTKDSLPGKDYLEEVTKGIAECDVFLILITGNSLNSYQVSKEVGVAHQLNKAILPILISVPREKLMEQRPGWVTAFSTSVYLQWPELSWQAIYSKLRQSVASVAVEKSEGIRKLAERVEKIDSSKKPKKAWAAEAQLIDISNISDVVHRTPEIDEFLDSDGQFFISANKGFGKSLMLMTKRAMLEKEHSHGSRDSGKKRQVTFIPEERPFLDILTAELPSLSSNHLKFLGELRNCRRLWSFAIRLSIIAHCEPEFERLDREAFHAAAGVQLDQYLGPKIRPTGVFQSLLFLPISSIIRLLDEFETKLDFAFRGIHQAIYVFIDRIDQGISSLDKMGWISVQAGLVEAAWSVMSSNSHVKIYASLREEAYANYESDTKSNLFSSTIHLRYNESELQSIIERLSMLYERQGFSDFVCMKVVQNVSCEVVEDSFRYLLRHTLGRPRDLVIICANLSSYRIQMNETKFREVVNETGANFIIRNVFSEMRPFLNCLRTTEDRQRFYRLLECNVFTRSELENICYEFNGIPPEQLANEPFSHEVTHHPFCELYSCGLLGIAREDDSLGGLQQFRQPYDVMTPTGTSLPVADYYFLHPCLHSLVYKSRYGDGYDFFRSVVIGHNYPWPPGMREVFQLQRALLRLENRPLKAKALEWLTRSMNRTSLVGEISIDDHCQVAEILRDLDQYGLEDAWVAMQSYCESRGIVF